MKLKALIGAAAIAAALPAAASAAVLGQLDISGVINNATTTFSPTGGVDFAQPMLGTAEIATGIFADIITVNEFLLGGGDPTTFDLFDINFADAPETIYAGGGFSFIASSFFGFDNETLTDDDRGFSARGTVFGPSGLRLPGTFAFSTQGIQAQVSFSSTTTAVPLPASVLMLLGALGGLGVLSRRRQVA